MKVSHPQIETWLSISGALMDIASLAARSARRQLVRATQQRRGQTLRPGPDTPLWNALVLSVRAQLVRRGDKAGLARYLGLPRQRVDDFLQGRRALPDAERTLLLLAWLASKKQNPTPRIANDNVT
jgi:hypothetical protein